MKIKVILFKTFCLLVFILLASIVLAGKQPPLGEVHLQKLKRISKFIAEELTKRGIKTVVVEDFKDYEGKPSAEGSSMAKEFKKQLSFNKGFTIVDEAGETVIKGTIIPFKGKRKWKLELRLLKADTGDVITSYTGILLKPLKKKLKK